MNKQIFIYDTTLRDGMQGTGINFTLQDKIQITRRLDEMMFDYIEGGFPYSNEKEAAFFGEFQKSPLSFSKLVAFGSTRAPNSKAKEAPHINALLRVETPAVAIVCKSSLPHVEAVLKTSREENLNMLHDSISHCKQEGREVICDLEHLFDGYIDNPKFALEVIKTAGSAGADYVVLCDTNGGTLPGKVMAIISEISEQLSTLPGFPPIGVHFHNDCGTGVANSLVGVDLGAEMVQGTINGWGERSGNANLCAIVPNLCLKTKHHISMKQHLPELTLLSRFLSEKANLVPDKRQPYVGEAAFSHKAGQHADVIQKAPQLMEHVDASEVGNERKILLSELAGKSTVIEKMEKYGTFSKQSLEVGKLIQLLKKREGVGYEYEAAEASFDLLVRQVIGVYRSMFTLSNYHLESFKTEGVTSKTVGRVFLDVGESRHMGAGVGVGPVECLDKALRNALVPIYPFLEKISLVDYKVRVLNPEQASSAKVRVFIASSDHNQSWDTVGVSENIVEASWEALTDSFEYYYNEVAGQDTSKSG